VTGRVVLALVLVACLPRPVVAQQEVPGRNVLYALDGSADRPPFSFELDQRSGMYRKADGTIGFSFNAGDAFDYNGSRVKLSSGVTLDWNATSINATEAGYLDGVTCGTVTVSKVLCADANKDLASLRYLTMTAAYVPTIHFNATPDSTTVRLTNPTSGQMLVTNGVGGNGEVKAAYFTATGEIASPLVITPAVGTQTAADFTIRTNNINRLFVNPTGHVLFSTDGASNIGTAGDYRPNSIWASALIGVGTHAATNGAFNAANNVVALAARNQANNGNLHLIGSDSNNNTTLGNTSGSVVPYNGDGTGILGSILSRFSSANIANSIAIGTSPAGSGALRLAHGGIINGNNNAGSDNRNLLNWGGVATDELVIGNASSVLRHRTSGATPSSLANGDWWVECTGSSPTRVCATKVYDGGATRTIASSTY